MALESFLYANYYQYFINTLKNKPIIEGLPFTFLSKRISQQAELTQYRHSLVNFGNYVYVRPMIMTLSGVKFSVDYFEKNPVLTLQLIMEAQKIAPLFFADSDYNGFVFLNSWECTKGNEDVFGTYSFNLTMYNLGILAQIPGNDVQFTDNITQFSDGLEVVDKY